MRKGYFIGAVSAYAIALILNLSHLLDWPDAYIGIVNLLASIVFVGFLGYVGYNDFINATYNRVKNVFFNIGIFSGIIIGVMHLLRDKILGFLPALEFFYNLDSIFYVLFVAPMFGINYFLQLDVELFAFVSGLLYLICTFVKKRK